MKRFELTKGIKIIIATVMVAVIGAIIVGILSNSNTMATTRNLFKVWKYNVLR